MCAPATSIGAGSVAVGGSGQSVAHGRAEAGAVGGNDDERCETVLVGEAEGSVEDRCERITGVGVRSGETEHTGRQRRTPRAQKTQCTRADKRVVDPIRGDHSNGGGGRVVRRQHARCTRRAGWDPLH